MGVSTLGSGFTENLEMTNSLKCLRSNTTNHTKEQKKKAKLFCWGFSAIKNPHKTNINIKMDTALSTSLDFFVKKSHQPETMYNLENNQVTKKYNFLSLTNYDELPKAKRG